MKYMKEVYQPMQVQEYEPGVKDMVDKELKLPEDSELIEGLWKKEQKLLHRCKRDLVCEIMTMATDIYRQTEQAGQLHKRQVGEGREELRNFDLKIIYRVGRSWREERFWPNTKEEYAIFKSE